MFEVRKDEGFTPQPGEPWGTLVSRHRTRKAAEHKMRREMSVYAREFYGADWRRHVDAYAEIFHVERS